MKIEGNRFEANKGGSRSTRGKTPPDYAGDYRGVRRVLFASLEDGERRTSEIQLGVVDGEALAVGEGVRGPEGYSYRLTYGGIYLKTAEVEEAGGVDAAVEAVVVQIIKAIQLSRKSIFLRELAEGEDLKEADWGVVFESLDFSKSFEGFSQDLMAIPGLCPVELEYIQTFDPDKVRAFPFLSAVLYLYQYRNFDWENDEAGVFLHRFIQAAAGAPVDLGVEIDEIWNRVEDTLNSSVLAEFLIYAISRGRVVEAALEKLLTCDLDQGDAERLAAFFIDHRGPELLNEAQVNVLAKAAYPRRPHDVHRAWPEYQAAYERAHEAIHYRRYALQCGLRDLYGEEVENMGELKIDELPVGSRIIVTRLKHNELFDVKDLNHVEARIVERDNSYAVFELTYKNGEKSVETPFEEFFTIGDWGTVEFNDEKGETVNFVPYGDEAVCHVILPNLQYEEAPSLPDLLHSHTRFEVVGEEEGTRILNNAIIDGDEYKGLKLTTSVLKEWGMEPKQKLDVGGGTVYFSAPIISPKCRASRIMYVQTADGIFCRSVYESNTHAVWRIMPFYDLNDDGDLVRRGKGHNEQGINLPFSVMKALHTDESPLVELGPDDYHFFIAGVTHKNANPSGYDETTMSPDSYLQAVKASGQPCNMALAEGSVDGFDFESDLYEGSVRAEIVLSEDGEWRHIFFRDKYDRVWTADPEPSNGVLSSYGVFSEFGTIEKPLPAYSYTSEVPSTKLNFGLVNSNCSKQSSKYTYVDAFPRGIIMDSDGVVARYCETRKIAPKIHPISNS